MGFNPDTRYVEHVLSPSYERHKCRYLEIMLWINRAHVVMLTRQGILPGEQARALLEAMDHLDLDALRRSKFNPRFEDLFFTLEDQIAREAGEEAVGNMHLAFSRNDMDAAMFRMALRQDLLHIAGKVLDLRQALLNRAKEHTETVMLAHTHNQQAQPHTMAHYLAAMEDQLHRDFERLLGVMPRLNLSPMGACALGGTGFAIDRYLMQELLCFDGLVRNTYDAVSTADYAGELLAVLQVLLANLSRFVHDLMFWTSNEVNAVKLADGFVQTSSIMPQKRNPVALEHVRSLVGRALGQAQGLWTAFHNVPYGDVNDTADNIQPHLEAIMALTVGALELLTSMVDSMQVNQELLIERARSSLASTTELADTLVRRCSFAFRKAHKVVSAFVDRVTKAKGNPSESYAFYCEASIEVDPNKPLLNENEFRQALDPVHFVQVRSLPGGPAPDEMVRQHQDAIQRLARDRDTIASLLAKFAAAVQRMEDWKTLLTGQEGR